MSAFLAATPLAVILVGMGLLHRSAIIAGSAGLVLALILALTVFAAHGGGALSTAGLLGGALTEAIHSTATILWIILPALAIFEFQKRAGALDRIRDTLSSLTDNKRLQAILIAWFFGLFMEGAAGFGTPVALAAPLLAGLGYSPARAVVLALLGHAAGVSFGAVGTPALAQIELSGFGAREVAFQTAALHAVCAPFLLLLMVRLSSDAPLSRGDLGWTALAAICFLIPSLALAAFIGPELPSLGGALIGAAVFVTVLQRQGGSKSFALRPLLPDLAPYLIILILVLTTRLIPPFQEALSGLSLSWTMVGTFSGSFQPLYHPGTILFAGLVGSAFLTGRAAILKPAFGAALQRLVTVALALMIMLALSRLMVHSGMIEALALAAAGAGPAWPFLAPFVGILGTFITGSATASNILFTELQISTAQSLSLPEPLMVAVQGFGAAIGNIIAPHNIIAGAATVGIVGREGTVLSQTALPCLLYTAVGGCVVFVLLAV